MREPLRVRLKEQDEANALARELAGVDGLEVHRNGEGWEVSVDDVGGNGLVLRVLGGVRATLAGRAGASALVLLDGREYRMQGE